MPNAIRTSNHWTSAQAYVLATVCLLVGIAFGYLARGTPGTPSSASTPSPSGTAVAPASVASPSPSAGQLAATARNQAAPLLEQLGTSPDDAVLLARIGDVYYDSQQYHDAQQYYERSLRLKPEDADVRADLGTCYWYQGDADTALAQYQKALSYQPHHAGALYNLGMVRWQGKMDSKGAVQAWETLLKVHPDYRDKDKVLDLIAKAKSGASN